MKAALRTFGLVFAVSLLLLFVGSAAEAQDGQHCPLPEELVDCRELRECDARRCECDADGRIVRTVVEGHITRAGNVHERFESVRIVTFDDDGFLICHSLDDDGDQRVDEREDMEIDREARTITETVTRYGTVETQIRITFDETWNPVREEDLVTGETVRTMRYVFDDAGRAVEQYIDEGADGVEETRVEWSYSDDGMRIEEHVDSDMDGVAECTARIEPGCAVPYLYCSVRPCSPR